MAKRITNEEFLKKLVINSTHITPLEQYKNNNTKIMVRCDICGFEWNVIPRSLLSGHGCPKCSGQIRLTTAEFAEKLFSVNKDIEIIGEYLGSGEKIHVKCKKCNYEWNPTANSLISQNTGCPKCAGNLKLTNEQFLERMKKINPSIIIASKYINNHSFIQCICERCGYVWRARAGALLRGTGCGKCARNIKKSTEEFKKELKDIFPTITVIGEYKNTNTKIKVHCNVCGYEWLSIPNNLLNHEGCPKCAQKERTIRQTKSHSEFVSEVLKINPHITITGQYINSHEKIECRCNNCGYIWQPLAWDLIHGTGCPQCARTSTSFMEQIILQALRYVFGKDEVLSRDTQAIGMELDIYLPSFKLAIEPGSWTWHKDTLDNDRLKRNKCSNAGILLITLYDSYNSDTTPFVDNCYVYKSDLGSETDHGSLRVFVEHVLELINSPYVFETKEWEEIESIAYLKSRKPTTSDFINKLIPLNNKVTIIGEYRGAKIKIKCKCNSCGYEYYASPHHLLHGEGCPRCYGHIKKTITVFRNELYNINPNITVLSECYTNNNTKMSVRCTICGCVWVARANNLLHGTGCPECAKKRVAESHRLTHEQFLTKMVDKGNQNTIIIGTYINSKTKIKCKCKNCGFEWESTPNSLLQGHGCKICARLSKRNPMSNLN